MGAGSKRASCRGYYSRCAVLLLQICYVWILSTWVANFWERGFSKIRPPPSLSSHAHGHIFKSLRYTTKKWLVVAEGLLGVELRHLHQLTHSSASPTRKLSTKLTMLACLISFITKISLMMSSCENGEYSNQCPPLECSQRMPHPHTASFELIGTIYTVPVEIN